ncbi:3-hydroxyacyl-[acyl-carrier-protein] dehydratase FabZ [[Haemophilus] ducreyi]|uniref:3-hydroxyacyl-[acyl-carrier-protein] dehydratase FabZ n=2 Tax=Haemophilus ducreyi TaxID=730 RepID=FABZ_HAEDU|nr:3-hydroxyacyl-ACP dehydratase FabZ [[Haemophilus] ducreyi]Q7VM25.1 RecName: Full=3-hydroxyacyl-[acyl-carrier-protein] dehydratase FabZ; AltName: Full=(3R)-hydroxymyristoyl-[acyl-carrier-protein] dehydratase; Short=(3R)-hydroxymyristoyl-ACP dehydrase; AltName: Full=Beta-hydroxyacyl-ACP dehydratase [[Haemophilus] ducreyi 35000HP]AAP96038.1 (3R)-hydroxymyristoyl-acyl carrier protein dehydratase [[Haemophilus] ducreyi 35000HP]AKO31028.1 3-hydroxyacyl-ACP dehydratase [[Haemophilus] ducreyi]AKO324
MAIETAENRTPKVIEVTEIMNMLPHRYPFLLVDRVTDYEEGKWLRAIKNVTVNEPCFTGHFPSSPVFPGVLILEAMAQATGVLAVATYGKMREDELYYFAAIDNARFKRPVVPGDQLVLEVEFLKEIRGITKFTGKAYVNGKLACEADLMCARK